MGIGALVKRVREAVADAGEPVAADLRRVEVHLGHRLGERGGPLADACRSLIERGGKRLRPLVAILAGRACVPEAPEAWRIGLVAELVHTATLVHDDLVERSPLRRGGSSLHVARGRRTALLTGDYLVALAFSELAQLDASAALVRGLGETIARMAEGECLEEAGRRLARRGPSRSRRSVGTDCCSARRFSKSMTCWTGSATAARSANRCGWTSATGG